MSNIRFVELSSYEIPQPTEVKGKEWVSYGVDNGYYDILLGLKNSATNSALINSITDLIYGRGLKATNASSDLEGWANFLGTLSENELRCLTDDYYTLGQGFLQCVWNKAHTEIDKAYHTPTQNWRPEKCNEDGDIEGYYYHDDWANAKPTDEAMRVPAFGTSKEAIEIICIKPYRAGHFYFTPVEYQSGLAYAEVEIEVAKYHINNIHNKFSANHIINFNNGVPESDEMDAIENKIKRKFTGAEGDGIVVAFNRGAEEAADVQTVQLVNPHEQYQFIAEEASRKLMVSHRVISPILVGLKTESGIGSNADELRMASQLFDNTVIKPIQRQIIEGIEPILTANGYSFNLYFETSQPLEFLEVGAEDLDTADVAAKVGADVVDVPSIADTSAATAESPEEVAKVLVNKEASYNGAQIASALEIMTAVAEGTLTEDQAITFLIQMLQFDPEVARALFGGSSAATLSKMKDPLNLVDELGEDNLDGWDCIFEDEDFDDDGWDIEKAVRQANLDERYQRMSAVQKVQNFVSTGSARPNAKSDQDLDDKDLVVKVRYEYSPRTSSNNSREFCKRMVSAGKLYRREDIKQMSNKSVNPGWGPNGANTYDIFLYKGGGDCHHRWIRKIYARLNDSGDIDVRSPKAQSLIESYRAVKAAGYDKGEDPDYKKAKTLPKDMPNNGFLKPR